MPRPTTNSSTKFSIDRIRARAVLLRRYLKVLLKQYGAYADRSVWLEWDMFPAQGIEQRLSHMCYWALEYDRRNEEYGLRLPGTVIAPDVGEKHRDRVLKALALYGIEGKSQ